MSEIGKTLVSGHTLRYEGAPFDDEGRRATAFSTGGRGRAKCSCGELSPVLDSGYQRKRWHREHKKAVSA